MAGKQIVLKALSFFCAAQNRATGVPCNKKNRVKKEEAGVVIQLPAKAGEGSHSQTLKRMV